MRTGILIGWGLLPALASAHPGPHWAESASTMLAHFLSAPDHVAALAALGLGALCVAVLRFRRRA